MIKLVALVLATLSLAGCGRAFAAADLLSRKVQCAIEHQHLSDVEILAKCAVDPKDAKNVLDIVGESRRAALASCGR